MEFSLRRLLDFLLSYYHLCICVCVCVCVHVHVYCFFKNHLLVIWGFSMLRFLQVKALSQDLQNLYTHQNFKVKVRYSKRLIEEESFIFYFLKNKALIFTILSIFSMKKYPMHDVHFLENARFRPWFSVG